MKNAKKIVGGLSTALFLILSNGEAVYANTAGYVQFVNGDVQLTTSAGQTHSLQKGEPVNEGDTLTSAKNASAQIKMQDGGLVAIRPDTRLKFDSFKFSGQEDGSEKSFFSLFKGGFRAITGLIGRVNKASYRITTPTSTIGIRGTDHETIEVVQGSTWAAVAPTGTYNKVNKGETSMTTERGTIFVQPNQMGFAGAANEMPKLQPINTNLFTVAPAPAPQAGGVTEEAQQVRTSSVVDSTAQEQPAGSVPTTAVTTNVTQLPITTTGGVSLSGGGATGILPPQGQGGFTFFSTNAANGFSSGFSDTVAYTADLNGLSSFTSTTGGYSATRGTAIEIGGGAFLCRPRKL